jgi:quercetin dioxygenase-like cupin family protein
MYNIKRWQEIYSPNAAMLRYILASEGYNVYQWGDQPGMFYGLHKHDEEQSHWVFQGSLEVTVEGVGTFTLEAGDRDFMPADIYHSILTLGEEPVIYLIGEKIGKKIGKKKK